MGSNSFNLVAFVRLIQNRHPISTHSNWNWVGHSKFPTIHIFLREPFLNLLTPESDLTHSERLCWWHHSKYWNQSYRFLQFVREKCVCFWQSNTSQRATSANLTNLCNFWPWVHQFEPGDTKFVKPREFNPTLCDKFSAKLSMKTLYYEKSGCAGQQNS